MKKQVKIITTILMIIMLLTTLSNVALAAGEESSGGGWDPTPTITTMNQNKNITTAKLDSIGPVVITIVRTIGVIVAIVVLLILGIKYMAGSAEQRAEYKKTMVPYVVGAVLLFAATTIVSMIYDLVKEIK